MNLSGAEIRHIYLQSQGLSRPDTSTGKKAALETIKRLGYIQIDTLSVVARAHHHTLWSRNPAYSEDHLQSLMQDKKIFEYWAHAAAYLPMKAFRFSLVRKELYRKGKIHWFRDDNPKMKKFVLDRITAEGALQSRDFEHLRKNPGSWYEWKPAKRALEQLFMDGTLMVAGRKGFQKIYDLSERILPATVNRELPDEDEYCRHLIQTGLQANGLVSTGELSYLQGHLRPAITRNLRSMLKEGLITEVKAGTAKELYYGNTENLKTLLETDTDHIVHILSPFDNAVIQRKRLSSFFGFDYFIECYVPEHKRKFGYFCLPILDGEHFVARFDPKADRESGIFHIKSFHAEKGWKPDAAFATSFGEKLRDFAAFSGCQEIKAGKEVPSLLRKML
jgi:uncharacterized protein YcaQ